MDWGTLITGAIITAICVLPFILLSRGGKKQQKQLLQSLLNFAEKHHCKITQHDIWGNSAIGLDEKANVLFFLRRAEGQESAQHVNLAEIQKSRVINTSTAVSYKGSTNKVIDKLELCLTPAVKGKPDILLEFYNAEHDVQLTREIQVSEKWAKIVNDRPKVPQL